MRKTVLMSDLSGQEITDHVQIRIRNGDLDYVVDADRSEEIIEQLLAVANQRPKRGRPKKTT